MVVYGKSEEFITNSNKSWLVYYLESFGKAILLLLSNMYEKNYFNSFVVVAFYAVMYLIQRNRTIIFDQKTSLNFLATDKLLILASFVACSLFSPESYFYSFMILGTSVVNGMYVVFLIYMILTSSVIRC